MPEKPGPHRLITTLPSLASELQSLLLEANEPELAAQILDLKIVDRCRCGDDFCGSFYAEPKPHGSYGPNHRNVALTPEEGWLILDVVAGKIMFVEVLYRREIRDVLVDAVP